MQAQVADHILIPLLDGDYTLAQIARLDDTNDDLRALLYLTSRQMTLKSEVFAFGSRDVKAVIATDLALIPTNHWEIVGYEPIPDLARAAVDLTSDDTTLHDPSVIEAFANALHGLYPWDGFPDADFFTNLLRTPDKLPSRIRMSADMPQPDA